MQFLVSAFGSFHADLRYGLRLFRRDPAFTAVAVLILAVGIGATCAVFSVVSAVLLRPLPYADPDRIAVVWERNRALGYDAMSVAPPIYAEWRRERGAFAELCAFDSAEQFLDDGDTVAPVRRARVSASAFPLLGVSPRLGRLFTGADERPGGGPVAILSHRLWRERFGADPGAIGATIRLDEAPYTVVGVMPPPFSFPPRIVEATAAPSAPADVWVPLALDLDSGSRNAHFLTVLGRLEPGASLERARTVMAGLARRLALAHPDTSAGWGVRVVPLHEQVVGPARPQLAVLLGAVGFVLLIACANVSNLLLARGASRRRELALRLALGASRGRLARQMLVESALLALLGGAAGLVVAAWGVDALVRLAPADLPRLDPEQVGLDGRVVFFAIGLSLLSGVLAGLAPVFQKLSSNLAQRLKEGGRDHGEGREGLRLRSAFVVVQTALALVLLSGAGLLTRSFVELRTLDAGFDPDRALTMRLTLPRSGYEDAAARQAAYRAIEARLGARSGVEAAGLISDLPLAADRGGTGFRVEGAPEGEERTINLSVVTPGYFASLAIPLIRGRPLAAADDARREPVAFVNQALVRQHLGDGDALGRRIVLYGTTWRIVGIVGDVRHDSLRTEPGPVAYLPCAQWPPGRSMSLVIRPRPGSEVSAGAVREVVRGVDRAVAVHEVRTMDGIRAASLAPIRFSTVLVLGFSLVALVLAAVGLYAVLAWSVGRRIREMGIRMAVGAGRRDILALVIGQGMRLVGLGILLGAAASLALTRVLSNLLYDVGAADVPNLIAVALVLALAGGLACWVPARRATCVEPAIALRHE